jgi:MATE family multidrug resistance protein
MLLSIKKYFPFYKRLMKLAFPLVLTQAGQTTIQLIDNAMVGRVGTIELAAASFANSIFVVIMLFGMGLFFGITPLLGRAMGEGNDLKAAEIMKNGFSLSGIVLVVLFLFSWSLTWIMPFMGQPAQVVELAIPYYRTLVVSLVPFLFFILLKQVGEGMGNTLLAMVATISSNLLNVFFNYILIFGKLGFPELGLLGAGYATLISRIAMPLVLFAGFQKLSRIRFYFKLMYPVKSSFKQMKAIFKVGFPIAAQLVMEVSSFAGAAIMMGWLGDVPLAAHQVALSLASATFMIANGVAMATTIRVSYQLGNNDFNSMEKVAYSAVHLVVIYMALCGLAFYGFRYQLPYLFTTDAPVIKQAASLLVVAAIFQMFDGLQVVSLGVLRGFADVKAPMFIAGFSYVAIGLPVSYLCAFVFGYGPEGIWYGFVAGLVSAAILLSIRIRYKIKRIEKN